VKFAVIAHQRSETNLALARRGWRGASSYLLSPREALLNLGPGDIALNRLDVSPDLDAVEEGIWMVNQLEAQQVLVLNRPAALLAAHDKLITARLLKAAGVPHPSTQRLHSTPSVNGLRFPLVVKPRFGSWGRDVELCFDRKELQAYITRMVKRSWWCVGGVAQEFVPTQVSDLRVIVSAGEIVGAAARIPAPGEWRTNVALGGRSVPTIPTPQAGELAIAATRALAIDFAGVDLLPAGEGWVVLEVNGAVDVRDHYTLGSDVFGATLESLERAQEPSLLPA
jgi:RimK family alpha-L-glutamate ligase